MNQNRFPITAIYAGIGRGHPNYLDSVLRYIRRHHPSHHQQIRNITISDVSHGLAKLAWHGVSAVYRAGSRGGSVSRTYTRIRTRHTGYDPNSRSARLLGRDLRSYLRDYAGLCLVAHPLLAAILQPEHHVFYLHGEIAAPRESAVRGLERIYVPLAETKAKIAGRGIDPESILQTGLVLEPEILDDLDTTVINRQQRIASSRPLTIGFFVSGAYPKRHVALMTAAARSCLERNLRVRLFWGSDSGKAARLGRVLRRFCDDLEIDDSRRPRLCDSRCVIVTRPSREEETLRSIEYLPSLDLFVAAPHERVNWALGAGLPMMMIGPPIGSFAPENRGHILRAECGVEFSVPEMYTGFVPVIDALRLSGKLSEMVIAGRRIDAIDGARVVAEDLIRSM